ncbi:hypothetical protein DUNSADRAFT_7928 [Dunaliella salina]|uniref:Encoded protein n=1 Tax=Dunaliella salina TaxID=3046 RepID=A0ABQ7GKE4_DUNSA|nr:hypothetical protein DUNSADRAFT_7928 [Dunaliella salina]|eukprot:KAF5835078.1 hypothetical protein DUNSADRAFT_7928 [Dunaliella salina]
MGKGSSSRVVSFSVSAFVVWKKAVLLLRILSAPISLLILSILRMKLRVHFVAMKNGDGSISTRLMVLSKISVLPLEKGGFCRDVDFLRAYQWLLRC